MKHYWIFIWIGILAFTSSCSKDDSDALFPEYISPQALLSDITISLTEQTPVADSLLVDDEGIYLYIETTEVFPYGNYGILRSTFQTGDTLLIRLEDIIKPNVTIAPGAPAFTSVRIPEDVQHIVFLKGRETDQFDVVINDDVVILQPTQTSFTTCEYTLYLR